MEITEWALTRPTPHGFFLVLHGSVFFVFFPQMYFHSWPLTCLSETPYANEALRQPAKNLLYNRLLTRALCRLVTPQDSGLRGRRPGLLFCPCKGCYTLGEVSGCESLELFSSPEQNQPLGKVTSEVVCSFHDTLLPHKHNSSVKNDLPDI